MESVRRTEAGDLVRWPSCTSSLSSPPPDMAETISTPEESPRILQNHLYSSFLEGSTADVALHIRGSWEAVYKLHRVVLIQAGFFRPMFTTGFSESRFRHRGPRKYGPEQIDVIFDDPNITRPAFEICISRLYGGGPPIHISKSLVPTPLHPLTKSFPNPGLPDKIPPGHHPASPRFLLSLLATSVYLSIPSLAGQALKSILNTMGPTTVLRYLYFAIGKGIGPPDEHTLEAAVGLENVAQLTPDDDTISASDGGSLASMVPSLHIEDTNYETKKVDPAELKNDHEERESEPETTYFYGGVSNKVGEAAACWLVRWGGDVLSYEDPPSSTSPPLSRESKIPVIWAKNGLNATWVRALLSSDLLFVKSELERYEMAKAVVELRRRQGMDEVDELEFDQLFSQGIYYIHMTMEELIAISRDVSPTTGKPYVPFSHLQASLWDQSVLKYHVTNSSGREAGLGVALSTADLSSLVDANTEARSKPYYYLPPDLSERIGDATGIEEATMDQLFTGVPQDPKRATPALTSERNFFGILPERQKATTCIESDKTGNYKWLPYPPFRFGIEFWDIECLKDNVKMHSHTVWYAGSLYNAYVQVIRKKGVQLGVYLHRQSHVDTLPPFSVPHFRRGVEHVRMNNRVNSLPNPTATIQHSPSLPSFSPSPSSSSLSFVHRSTTPNSSVHATPGSPMVGGPQPPKSPVPHPPQPYRDPRSTIHAYFSIACCSATGSSITKFTSGPDEFGISRSWGWKSSSLRTEEYLELGEDGFPVADSEGHLAGKEVSLRATVTIGIV